MSKPSSGLFENTKGAINSNSTKKNNTPSSHKLSSDVKIWAKNTIRAFKSKRQRDKFNTASVVYDTATGKEYYGRNHGIVLDKSPRNKTLFGDNKKSGLLPTQSLNHYDVGNCAEVDAINKALNDGAKLKNLVMKTIHTTERNFGDNKKACENCTFAFKGKIKENYSGWKE